ncbi:MAG: hypothetical protein PSX37_02690 [bacterium]|nr:hypothetical protein [bacterium]
MTVPKPPAGLKACGRSLWTAIQKEYALAEHERSILNEACRTVDTIEALQALLDREGLTSVTSQGQRIHPALAELRQQRVTLARLLAALRIPTGDGEIRPGQHRGPRGVYGIGKAIS